MKAQLLERIWDLRSSDTPLRLVEIIEPKPGAGEVLIEIEACGVCHTELDEIEGRTPPPRYPIIPGHQVVGRIAAVGDNVESSLIGSRVGVAWIFSACGRCERCASGYENLCPDFKATGRDRNGGYAELMVVPEHFAIPIPDDFEAAVAAPLLCAGSIGYRSVKLSGLKNGEAICLAGFGASAELVLRLLRHSHPDSDLFVRARKEDVQKKAMDMGAVWAGDFESRLPVPVQAIIDTTPAWKPVLRSLESLRPGGRLVINAIRKEATDQDWLLKLRYEDHLWMEKQVISVANVTREDVRGFLDLAAINQIKPSFQEHGLDEANRVLIGLRRGTMRGSHVLIP